jgi:hypothetical protein
MLRPGGGGGGGCMATHKKCGVCGRVCRVVWVCKAGHSCGCVLARAQRCCCAAGLSGGQQLVCQGLVEGQTCRQFALPC